MRNYDEITDPKDLITKDYLSSNNIVFDNANVNIGSTAQIAIETLYTQILKTTNVDGGSPSSSYSDIINLDGGTP